MSAFENIYFKTRNIFLGKKNMDEKFRPFVNWFENTYNIKILNVETHDYTDGLGVDIWLYTESDVNFFCDPISTMPQRPFVAEIMKAYNDTMVHSNKRESVFFPWFTSKKRLCKTMLLMSFEQYEKRYIMEQLNDRVMYLLRIN